MGLLLTILGLGFVVFLIGRFWPDSDDDSFDGP